MKKVLFLFLLSSYSFAQEGVSTQIDSSRLNEVLEWVENAKYSLDTNLTSIQRSSISDQEEKYEALIDTILRQSGDKPNEFLMRNVLYRTKVVYASLKNSPPSPKRDVLARRVLEDGVSWAQRLYEPDMNLMRLAREGRLTEALRGTEFAKLGMEWAQYMLTLYYLAPTNEVKLQLMRDMMGLLYNDINNDDAVKRILAPISGAVVLQNESLKNDNPQSPTEELRLARELRRFMEQQLEVISSMLNLYQVNKTTTSTASVASSTNESDESTDGLGDSYITNNSNSCYLGYINGARYGDSQKYCLRVSSLKDSYITKNLYSCTSGFISGQKYGNSQKYCIRVTDLGSSYITKKINFCVDGYIAGSDYGRSQKYCLRVH